MFWRSIVKWARDRTRFEFGGIGTRQLRPRSLKSVIFLIHVSSVQGFFPFFLEYSMYRRVISSKSFSRPRKRRVDSIFFLSKLFHTQSQDTSLYAFFYTGRYFNDFVAVWRLGPLAGAQLKAWSEATPARQMRDDPGIGTRSVSETFNRLCPGGYINAATCWGKEALGFFVCLLSSPLPQHFLWFWYIMIPHPYPVVRLLCRRY